MTIWRKLARSEFFRFYFNERRIQAGVFVSSQLMAPIKRGGRLNVSYEPRKCRVHPDNFHFLISWNAKMSRVGKNEFYQLLMGPLNLERE